MISGGSDRKDLRPLDLDSQSRVRGSHKGAHSALNVQNPQEGMHYYWERADRSQLIQRANEGWQAVTGDAPESKGLELDPNMATALDTVQARQDVVLLRIPLDRYRQNVAEPRSLRRRAARDGATEEWLAKGVPYQKRFGSGADGPIYYRAPGHGVRREE